MQKLFFKSGCMAVLLLGFSSCSTEIKQSSTLVNSLEKMARDVRKIEHGIDKIFVERWSVRAMSGEKISDQDLMKLFEAAKWAPSDSNNQPWRFIYAQRETPEWNHFFDLLVDFNKLWAKNAAALVVIVSKDTYDDNTPSRTHSFDTGAAWMSLSLQGQMMGLVVHGIGGFDYDRARKDLAIPEGYTVEAMCAIGKPASVDVLPERMRKGEIPSQRKPLEQLIFKGTFKP